MTNHSKTFVIDIDDTILFSDNVECDHCGRKQYRLKNVDQKEIDMINAAYSKGHIIIFWTGRGWDQYGVTKKQLSEAKVYYHELFMGKPQGIYVDKDAKTTLEGLID